MPAHIIDGKALSQAVRDQIAKDAAALLARPATKRGRSAILDADGFHPYNMGRLVEGTPIFEACTPRGVIKMIESTGVGIAGRRAVVVGRSNIVGKPVALMLLHRHATVTICHSKTKDLPAVCREAEILVVAIGKARFVTADMVREGAVVVDVGVNRTADGKFVGDVDFEAVSRKAGWIS